MPKQAIITGASSGIGRALAHQLIDEYDLFLCGRNMDALKETTTSFNKDKHRWTLIELDLNDSQSILRAAQEILQKTDKVHLLINNAGVSQRALASETEEAVERELFQVNYFGPVAFTKLLLPALRKAQNARIAITSSIAGKFGYPLRSTYSAAKHALHGYFESLRLEEKTNKIYVQFLVIGRAKTQVSVNAIKGDGEHYGRMDKGQEKGISAERCAEKISTALKQDKKEVLIGGAEKWMVIFKKFLPYLFYRIAEKESNHV